MANIDIKVRDKIVPRHRVQKLKTLVFGQFFSCDGIIGMMIKPGKECEIAWFYKNGQPNVTHTYGSRGDCPVECLSLTGMSFDQEYV